MSTPEEKSSEAAKKKRVVLFPTDGSSHSERAFQWYLDHMMREDDCVKFVSVIEPYFTTPAIGMSMESPPLPDLSRVMDESIQNGKKLCQQWMRNAKSHGLTSQAFIHIDSKPGAAIVKAIKEHKADVVVLGNRGLGLIRRTFLGSVTEYVLHHAHIPIVVVPPGSTESK